MYFQEATRLLQRVPCTQLIRSQVAPREIRAHFHGTEVAKPIPAYQVYKGTVFALFRDELGCRFLGGWAQRDGNSNVEEPLTGFDAPPCTYLYIDKSMQDHGLFRAICRTNRLDGDDKEFGYIVDYKDLFRKVEDAIAVYTPELDRSAGGSDPDVLLQDRLRKDENAWTTPWRRWPSSPSPWSRRGARWRTSGTSAATPSPRSA